MRQQSQIQQFGQDAQTTKERLLRAAVNGRYLDEPPQPAPDAPGYRSGSTGKFVGYAIDEHDAKRSTETGRIKSIGPAESIPRSELVARYGRPDNATRTGSGPVFRSEERQGFTESAAAGFGVDPETVDGLDPVETSGVTDSAYDRDMLAGEGKRPAGGANRGGVSQGVVDDLATGRDADMAFTSAEDERSGDPFDITSGGVGESVELFGGGSDSGRFGDSSPEDEIATDPGTAGRAVEEFNAGGMGLGELGAELEGRR